MTGLEPRSGGGRPRGPGLTSGRSPDTLGSIANPESAAMSLSQRLMSTIESYREPMIEAQRQLTAIPALGPENGGQGELAKAELVQKWCGELGLALTRVDAPDERVASGLRPNLLATLAGGEGPAVWILSHLDVVPPGPRELWSSDPWTLRVEGDRLYGRGVMDNQAGLVSSLFAVKALKELGVTPPGPAGLVLVSDEETGSGHGLDYLLSEKPQFFTPRDLILVTDSGEPDGSLIEVAEKSILWLKVTATGQQVHASTPQRGVNALYASARMMVAVRELYQEFPSRDPLFDPPISTFEPTRKDAGVPNINTVPGRDVFYVDCRLLPDLSIEETLQALSARLRAIAQQEGVTVEISTVQGLPAPAATSPDAPVVKALSRAVEAVHGIKARPGGLGGGTVAAFFRQRGLPVAVWLCYQHTVHMPDEYCLISQMIGDSQVMARLCAGLAED